MAQSSVQNPGRAEQALQAVANSFEGIRRENGYKNEVVQVLRHYVEEDALGVKDCPAIFVLRPEGATGTIQWQDERAYKETIRLDVIGLLKAGGTNNESGELASLAEGLLSDMKKLAMSDVSFGTGVNGVILESRIVSDGNDAGWDATSALVGIGLEIDVLWDGTNP